MKTTKDMMIEKAVEELMDEYEDKLRDALSDMSTEEVVAIASEYTGKEYYTSLEDLVEDHCYGYLEAFQLGQNSCEVDEYCDAYGFDNWDNEVTSYCVDDLFDADELVRDALADGETYGSDTIADIISEFDEEKKEVIRDIEEQYEKEEAYADALKKFGNAVLKVYAVTDVEKIESITEAINKILTETPSEKSAREIVASFVKEA